MEDLYSVFICQERDEELRQKLMDATHELETMKNLKMELFNLLKIAYQERDEARCQLQKLIMDNHNHNHNHNLNFNFNFIPSSPIQKQNNNNKNETFVMLPMAKPTSSITESKSFSHDGSFYDSVSSPTVFDSNNNNNIGNNCYINNNFSSSKHDPADEVIEFLAKGKVLPQKGKLLQSVMDSGPLLQNLLLSGPLPCWRNPPPLQQINVPPHLNIINDYAGNSSSLLYCSNAISKCSASSMLNFGGNNNNVSSWNNNSAWQLSSGSGFRIQVPPRKRQRNFL